MLYSNIIPLLYLCIVSSLSTSRYPNSTLQERIAIYLHELCPGSGVCMNDVIDPDDKTFSCCGVCSCSNDCGSREKCCFPNLKTASDDSTLLTTNQYSECIYPVTTNVQTSARSYTMITASRQDADNRNGMNMTVTCGDTKVAPWGSLYPVYSKTTGKIYKNIVCAESYGVTDGEHWRAYLSCANRGVGFDSGIDRGRISDNCLVIFVYPGDTTLLFSEVCLNAYDFVSTCIPGHAFGIPAFTTATRDDIVAACESGLLSPYSVYRNIFCVICDLASPPLNEFKCSLDELASKLPGQSLTMVIDDMFALTQFTRRENTNIACVGSLHQQLNNTGDPACRPIICPSGQMLSKDQKCIYSGHEWIVKSLNVYLNLNSSEPTDVLPLLRSVNNLRSPWPNTWAINSLTYDTKDEDFQATRLMVMQTINFDSPIKPEIFFKRLQSYLDKDWFLVSSNNTVKLQATLSKYKSLYSDVFHSTSIIRRIRVSSYSELPVVYITPVFFCELVTLSSSEFKLPKGLDSIFVFNKISNSKVYDGEFILITNQEGNVSEVKVCLEKSGFYRISQSSSTSLIMNSNDSNLICFVSILILHFICGFILCAY